ncbi:MAG TPA: M66 family metalloprotease [Bdellovibrionota bacterium]|nr:M66 family metalloprotease [Bdellovibrionota bacterium]
MIFGFILALATVLTSPAHAAAKHPKHDPTSLLESSRPGYFKARTSPVVNAIVIHYGSAVTETDLRRAGALLATRFSESTQGAFQLNVLDYRVVPLKVMDRNLDEIAKEIPGTDDKKTPERLTRLWYYYHSPGSIADEVRGEMARIPDLAASMRQADAVLVLSEPQFEGLGYADGAYGITEQPQEIAWGGQGGGWTEFQTDGRVADELLHELGHILGLNHAAAQCDPANPDYRKCCDESPGGKDVMSYCRSRSSVTETFYFGFTDCTRNFLTTETLPDLLGGKHRPWQTQGCL